MKSKQDKQISWSLEKGKSIRKSIQNEHVTHQQPSPALTPAFSHFGGVMPCWRAATNKITLNVTIRNVSCLNTVSPEQIFNQTVYELLSCIVRKIFQQGSLSFCISVPILLSLLLVNANTDDRAMLKVMKTSIHQPLVLNTNFSLKAGARDDGGDYRLQ